MYAGPLACLDFSTNGNLLASGSWDGTLKIWDVYKNTCLETFEHGCDVLALAFRPDGKQLCTATTNGNITFWDPESGNQIKVIEGDQSRYLTVDLFRSQFTRAKRHKWWEAYDGHGDSEQLKS